jgi:putative ABC transport system permease protein
MFDVIAGEVDVWVPAGMQRSGQNSRGNHYLTIVGRLKPDVSLAQAQAEVDAVQAGILEGLSGDWQDSRVTIYPLLDDVVGPTGTMLFVLMGAAGLVLLIACVNVANLFLARSIARQKEIAVRAALGSGRLRLAAQLLVESLVIAAIGGVAGLAATVVGVRVLLAVSPESLARAEAISFDPTLLAFTAAMTILTGLLFGVAPAWQALKVDLNHILRDASRGSTAGVHGKHLRGALVSGQMALAVVLLVGAGLLIKSFVELQQLELGVDPENVATFEVNLPSARYADAEQRVRFHQSFQDRMRTISGVRGAGAISKLPVSGEYHIWGYQWDTPEGMSDWTSLQVRVVEGDYFEALGIAVVEGRGFESGDRVDTPSVALLNRAAAEFAFADREAVGGQISINGGPERTVVGVIEDVAHDHRGEFARKVYIPHSQFADNRNWSLTQVVKTETLRPDLWDLATLELAAIDPDLVLHNPEAMTDVMAREIARDRFALMLMGVFAVVALALAAIGVYGVLSYLVSQRTSEIGIRMALGARASQVRAIVLGHAALLTGIGIAVGLVGAFGLSRLLNSMVFGVSVTDPVIFASVAVGLGVIAIVAGYVPARRATRVDPMQALRNE